MFILFMRTTLPVRFYVLSRAEFIDSAVAEQEVNRDEARKVNDDIGLFKIIT
jgi:hypothetical protein